MRTPRAVRLTAPLLALALAASACGGGDDDGGSEKSLDDIAAKDINATDRENIEDGGTFNWGLNEYPTQYNMFHPDGNLANVHEIAASVMPVMMDFDESGEASPDPDYVESAELSDDGLTLTLQLNPDAEWSNGEPITWEDYEAQAMTVGKHRDDADEFKVGDSTGYDLIESVEEGSDEYEAVLEFESPYAEWPGLFDPLYPKEYMTDPEKFNEGYKKDFPVTAGPFGDVEFDDTAENVTVNKNGDWWGDPAKLDEIIFHGYENDALAKVFDNGEIDGFHLVTDASAYERLKDKDGARITEAVDNSFRMLSLNGGEGTTLENPELRNALIHGIDRSELAGASLDAIDWPSDPTANRMLRSSQTGYQDNSEGYGEYDPDKANEMLDEAGWTREDEDSVRTNEDGDKLAIDWVVVSGLQAAQDEAEIAKTQLDKVGIKVNIESVPNNGYFDDYIRPGKYDIATYSLVSTNPYAGDSAENFTGPHGEDDNGDPVWGNNLAFTSTDEINTKFEELAEETDPEKYAEIANEIDRALWEHGMAAPLFQRPGNYAVDAELANWGGFGLASTHYEDIGWEK
ncbi:peptide/nickel transport system substrate-binding protein [Haloactinospora alba]|uniref:Peptide/nickel transport system substrate-binding protein n=1 Tax=Haloactinospora alba TaxID=405555 RepID=A0A543NGC8_9ACTN|nr:ABC transporter family substrate-binding protein [Haloactinospora alba]TQN30905.1 peptide/nickel transport system substrate-binding protein [Haloactinospora alba]